MTNYSNASLFLSLLLITILTTSIQSNAISSCYGPCQTLNDCSGQLICINGKCNDDPDVGTRICFPGTTPSPPSPSGSGNAISSCNGPCQTLNDCSGQLICINRKCNDDPDVGTRICSPGTTPSPPSPSGTTCNPTGFTSCGNKNTYQCSPPVTSATPAKLTLNDFSEGGDGGDPSSCDGKWHAKTELVVALSTGWFNGSSRCLKMIRITANGKSVTAKVVDECDSMNGCDQEHAFQPPCDNNVVDGSDAVWEALGLNKDLGIVPVTWSMA